MVLALGLFMSLFFVHLSWYRDFYEKEVSFNRVSLYILVWLLSIFLPSLLSLPDLFIDFVYFFAFFVSSIYLLISLSDVKASWEFRQHLFHLTLLSWYYVIAFEGVFYAGFALLIFSIVSILKAGYTYIFTQ